MPQRKFDAGSGYRYGFNGKELDNESAVKYDYGFRIYDLRLGRFLSRDPLWKKYPELTPYQFASNSPISMIDIDGLEGSMSISGANMVSPLFQRVEFDVDGDKIPDYNRGWAGGMLMTLGGGLAVLTGGAATAFIGSASTASVVTNITAQAVVNFSMYSTAAVNAGAFIIELANPDPNGTPGLEFTQGDEIARGVKLLFKQTAAPLIKPAEKFIINTSKLDYLFGKLEYQNLKGADLESYAGKVGRTVESLTHNQDRASSIAKVFEYWGIKDNKAGFEKLADFFNIGLNGKVVGNANYTEHGTSITREISLIFTEGEKKGQSAGSLQISYFYKNGDMNATPEITSVIPIPDKKL